MKKILKLLAIFSLFLGLTACSTSKEATPEDFKSSTESRGYEVSSVSGTDALNAKEAYKAVFFDEEENPIYGFYFYVFNSEDEAKEVFNNIKVDYFGKYENDNSEIKNFDSNGTMRYTLSGDGFYGFISTVGSTVLYTDVLEEYKDEIVEVAQELGY